VIIEVRSAKEEKAREDETKKRVATSPSLPIPF